MNLRELLCKSTNYSKMEAIGMEKQSSRPHLHNLSVIRHGPHEVVYDSLWRWQWALSGIRLQKLEFLAFICLPAEKNTTFALKLISV